jgi:predicted transcriptional regulator
LGAKKVGEYNPVMTRVIKYMTCVIFIYISNRNRRIGGRLLLPCEVGVKTVLPAIRALMARDIVEKHGMKEQQAAEILGLSQSAISRYTTKDRGNLITIEDVPEVQTRVDQMINLLLREKPHQTLQLLELFCETCKLIREKGLMCQPCQKKTPRPTAETCAFCRST